MIEIIRILSRNTKSYFYQKVYFKSGSYNMCVKKYTNYFLKSESIKWYKEKITYRQSKTGDINREYRDYVLYHFNDDRQTEFYKELKNYKFRLRKEKIKRLI